MTELSTNPSIIFHSNGYQDSNDEFAECTPLPTVPGLMCPLCAMSTVGLNDIVQIDDHLLYHHNITSSDMRRLLLSDLRLGKDKNQWNLQVKLTPCSRQEAGTNTECEYGQRSFSTAWMLNDFSLPLVRVKDSPRQICGHVSMSDDAAGLDSADGYGNTYTCSHCPRVFTSLIGLKVHLTWVLCRRNDGKELLEEDDVEELAEDMLPSEASKENNMQHVPVMPPGPGHWCSHCYRLFPTAQSLSVHKAWFKRQRSASFLAAVSAARSVPTPQPPPPPPPAPAPTSPEKSEHPPPEQLALPLLPEEKTDIHCFHCFLVFATFQSHLQHMRSTLKYGHISADQLAFHRLSESVGALATHYRYDTTEWSAEEVDLMLTADFRPWMCTQCRVLWPSERLARQHQREAHPPLSPPSPQPALKAASSTNLQTLSISPWAAPVDEFFCRHCRLRFHSKAQLQGHEEVCLALPRQCPKCRVHFNSNYAMLSHQQYCGGQEGGQRLPAKVVKCEATMPVECVVFEMEKYSDQNGASVSCPYCGKLFMRSCGLGSHVRFCKDKAHPHLPPPTAHEEENANSVVVNKFPHACFHCGRRFQYAWNLSVHMQQCKRDDGETVKQEKHDAVSAVSLSPTVKEGNGISCRKCKQRFNSLAELQLHSRQHCPMNQHKCQHCGGQFTSRGNLQEHQMWSCDRRTVPAPEVTTTTTAPPPPPPAAPAVAATAATAAAPHQFSGWPNQDVYVSSTCNGISGTSNKFGCSICGLLFSSEQRLARHKELTHVSYVPVVKRCRLELAQITKVT